MGFKKLRLGPQLHREANDPAFFGHVHVILGGSGAVGGATALQLVSLYEEVARLRPPSLGDAPRIVITARTKQELRQFTSILFRLQQREHGAQPTPLSNLGYRTARGVLVELNTLDINPDIPELSRFASLSEAERERAVRHFLASQKLGAGASLREKVDAVRGAIRERLGRPFTDFLLRYRQTRGLVGAQTRFRSVIISIPLASIVSYKLNDFELACAHLGIDPLSAHMGELKNEYLQAISDDLAYVAAELAHDVVAAHTTAVGGMYDEEADGTRAIRLGFAHSALDERLKFKQTFADELTRLYAQRGIKMLITAAAIGIDSVVVHKAPPLNPAVRRLLLDAQAAGHRVLADPGADRLREVRAYPPAALGLEGEPHEPVGFAHGRALVLDYVLKSGENGFFTVSNTDALYRVMRVTSSAELGLLLARTAVFGDDPLYPSFVNNVCYYSETDNSRQVFDLLSQRRLRDNQLSGLQPKALQDLGSAKHQCELHTLGLLILLHRLQTLDLEAIPREAALKSFDPREFFERHSQRLTLEHCLGWDARALAARLVTLVTANSESDLAPLKHYYQPDPGRQDAIHRVLREVVWAVRAVPSLGTPILYEEAGRRRVLAGPYVAPLDQALTHRDTVSSSLRRGFEEGGGGDAAAFERFVEFNLASNGFADLRPLAVLVTARSGAGDLSGQVRVFREEGPFLDALSRLEPYTYFTTSGLLALLVRLRGLYRLSRELDFGLGSANEFRAQFYHDEADRPVLVPGVVEAFRMISEGLEKNTGSERLDGRWGYYARPAEAEARPEARAEGDEA